MFFFCKILTVQNGSVDGNRHDLPGQEFAAVLQCGNCGLFQTTAARYFHAHHRDALDVVLTDDFGEFFAVIRCIQLGTADERDLAPDKVLVEVCIGIGSAVRRNQQVCSIKVRRLYRYKLDLNRPLAELGGCINSSDG